MAVFRCFTSVINMKLILTISSFENLRFNYVTFYLED